MNKKKGELLMTTGLAILFYGWTFPIQILLMIFKGPEAADRFLDKILGN